MLFAQNERFSESKNEIEGSNVSAGFYYTKSALSRKGTKIVDNWYAVEGPRFNERLVIKDNIVFYPSSSSNESPQLELNVNIKAIKPRSSACCFSKGSERVFQPDNCDTPGAIYKLPELIDKSKCSIVYRSPTPKSSKVREEYTCGTVLSLESANICYAAISRSSPMCTMPSKSN